MTRIDAFFLPVGQSRRFCILHSDGSRARARGAIVYVHPFAEEMNKARRMAALQARALAAAGWTVLQLDLFGCGDSDGDFGEADWKRWQDDVLAAAAWLRAEREPVSALWGARAGCLLAARAACELAPAPDLLLWQPVVSGRLHLQQFLRLKVAGQIVDPEAQERARTDVLRAQLLAGATVEIAGYALAPGLAAGLDAATLSPPPARSRVAWLEVAADSGADLTPASRRAIEAFTAAGHAVDARAVDGPAYWQTQEITESPALIAATGEVIARWE